MRNPIVIARQPEKASPFLRNIFTTENVAEATFQFSSSFTSGIFEGTGTPMPKKITAFALPMAGGKRHE